MTQSADRWSFDEKRYAPVHARQGGSTIIRRIWASVYGPDYPADLEPLGFSTTAELERLAALVAIDPGGRLIDLGCGRGGPGLWIARRTNASLTGIDVVREAVEQAERRKAALWPDATFHVASVSKMAFETSWFDAAVSVDALWMVLDKPAALKEISRILKPGGRFAFTTWEPEYLDHHRLLEQAGFQVILREEPVGWRDRQLTVYERIRAEERALRQELGDHAASVLLAEANAVPDLLDEQTRLLMAAENS